MADQCVHCFCAVSICHNMLLACHLHLLLFRPVKLMMEMKRQIWRLIQLRLSRCTNQPNWHLCIMVSLYAFILLK